MHLNAFDIGSILVAAAAAFGYLNHRLLKLPQTSGTLAVALIASVALLAVQALFPTLVVRSSIATFLNEVDFDRTLMHGMLCFLLFAGALHVDLHGLVENRWTIAALATAGVLVSTAVIGLLMWWTFGWIAEPLSLTQCLLFGALISPTDPIAAAGMLRDLRGAGMLEAQIAGESLFNDGIGVVVFFALLSSAGLAPPSDAGFTGSTATGLALFFARQVGGAVVLGLSMGYAGYRALRSIDDHPLELLITVALAMFLYSLAFWVQVSAPIAVVVAGLLIGNPGRQFAMSRRTVERVDAFWNMIDSVLNAVLFLLLGVGVFALPVNGRIIAAALVSVPVALVARFVSVALPVAAIRPARSRRGLVPLLTWSGVRGGISVAMVLSLPQFGGKGLLLACTYAVVVFSILVQGLTVPKLVRRFQC